jgi:rhodanese-related sulfurtransferase
MGLFENFSLTGFLLTAESNPMGNGKFILLCFMLLSVLLMLSELPGQAYAQEAKKILSIEAYDMLNTVPDTYLIDVRTRAEYQFVGHPFKAYLFPYMFWSTNLAKEDDKHAYQLGPKNKFFVEEISKVFKKTDNLLIMGRDGTRSRLAAKALIDAGYKNIFDVEDGFEGAEFPTFEDKNRHKFYRQLAKRNKIHAFKHRRHYGWQWWGLPWTYEIDPKYIYPPDLTPPKK